MKYKVKGILDDLSVDALAALLNALADKIIF